MAADTATVSARARTGEASAHTNERPPRGSSRSCIAGARLFAAVLAAHQEADLAERDIARAIRLRKPSAGDDRDAVAQHQDLIEILRQHHDRGAGFGELDQGAMNDRGGADVHAPGRLADDQEARRLLDLAAD